MPFKPAEESRVCAADDCEVVFKPKTFNQKFCCPECTQRQTNKVLLARYHTKKNRKTTKGRVCKTRGCITILSSYNEDDICELCKRRKFEDKLREWGWEEEDFEDFVL